MAIALRSSSSGDVSAPGTSLTITKPASTANTDVLVAIFGQLNSLGSTMSVTAPAGWTAIHAGQAGSNGLNAIRVDGFWALGSVSNLGFTLNGNESAGGWVCLAFTGVDNTTPIDATGTTNSNIGAATLTANAVTTVTDKALELIGCADFNKGQMTATGFTQVENGAVNASACCLYSNAVTSPAGSTGTKVISDSGATSGQIIVAMPFALRPAATTWTTSVSDNLGISDLPLLQVSSFRFLSDSLGISDIMGQFAFLRNRSPLTGVVSPDPRFLLTGFSCAAGLLYGFKAIARNWTFSVSGIANKGCLACNGYNGTQTITYDTATWTWHGGQSPCYGDSFTWRMYGIFNRPTPVMHLEIQQVAYPSGTCYPSSQQLDAWEIPISQFSPTGVNVLPHVTTDSRTCRDCDASSVGSITITPVF